TFDALAGVTLFALVYLSGIASTSGGILSGFLVAGGLMYVLLTQLAHLGQYFDIVSGLGLILTAILNPRGITGDFLEKIEQFRERRVRSFGDHSPSSTKRTLAATRAEVRSVEVE
ncbi:MAG: ABC transporter, partial [Acidimicrobiales bacterium]